MKWVSKNISIGPSYSMASSFQDFELMFDTEVGQLAELILLNPGMLMWLDFSLLLVIL